MKTTTTFLIPVLLVINILSGCSSAVDSNCTQNYEYAVEVTLMDFETNQPIPAGKPTGKVREGNYIDSMIISNRSENSNEYILLRGAGERAGKYSVSVELDGYQTWTKDNIIATRNDCHVNQQKITAFLKKK